MKNGFIPFPASGHPKKMGYVQRIAVSAVVAGMAIGGSAVGFLGWGSAAAAPLVSGRGPMLREARKVSIEANVGADAVAVAGGEISPSEMLSFIHSSLHFTTSAIARAAGVSRQTVHAWQNGSAVSPENLLTIKNLYIAAGSLSQIEPNALRSLVKRTIGGATFSERIARGDDGQSVALELLRLHKVEAGQLATLEAKRRTGSDTIDTSTLGIPRSDES